jgi:hypothetical protein
LFEGWGSARLVGGRGTAEEEVDGVDIGVEAPVLDGD